jgi:DNA-binding LacI/PurR family transcriptional regulator
MPHGPGRRSSAEPAPRDPTMADIANHLGVSRQLVSLVLRELQGPSAATRERVMRAAEELGYSPHMAARTLRQSKSRHLGVAFTPAHATEPDIVERIYPAAARCGYTVVLSAQTATRSTTQAVEELLGYRCAAVVIIGGDLGAKQLALLAKRAKVPVVVVGWGRRNSAYDVVRSAGDVGISLAVRHLVALGHRSVTYVHCESMPPAALRLEGYLSAASKAGLEPAVLRVEGDDFTEEAGASAARQLMKRASLPTAVATGNDQIAVGLMQVLTRGGVPVPERVSVTGFDDSRFARLSSVDLTTARQDPGEMGDAAVAAALRRIDSPSSRPAEAVIEATLVIRGSTSTPH